MSTIKRIKATIPGIQSHYDGFDVKHYTDTSLDDAGEYTPIIHQKLLKEIIEFLKAVVEHPTLFIQEFASGERNIIAKLAEGLYNNNLNYDDPENHLDSDKFKYLISRMRIIFGKKDALQYKSEVDTLQGLMARVDNMLAKEEHVRILKEEVESIRPNLANIVQNKKDAQQELDSIKSKGANMDDILTKSNTMFKDIIEKQAKIVAFFKEIEDNREKLEELKIQNTKLITQLEEDKATYIEERTKILEEIRATLGDANAVGLATAFEQRIQEAKKRLRWPWIAGAGTSIILAVGIVGWLLIDLGDSITLGNTLARLPITAMLLLAAWFCGSRYLKLESTLEDYQYKKALAQSMPAFMKQLEGSDQEQNAYLLSVFSQMLQDPLRKKHDFPSPWSQLIDTIPTKRPKDIKPPPGTEG